MSVEELENRRLLTVNLTGHEQLLLELINRARANPETEAQRYGVTLNHGVPRVDTITATPKQPLAPNEFLTDAARLHAQDMLDFDYFAHEGRDDSSPTDRAQRAGWPADAGENIAWWGSNGSINTTDQTFLRHEALFLSPGHRVNMLSGFYREAGLGIVLGEFEELNSVMVAEEFGNKLGDAFITGIAYSDEVTQDRFYTVGEQLPGVTVTATKNDTGEVFTTTTGASGGYALQVPNGIYSVTAAGGSMGASQRAINVVISSSNTKVDFNKRFPLFADVTGKAYEDFDRDGRRDAGETGIDQIILFIDNNSNAEFDIEETFVLSSASGDYEFQGLLPGDYQVRQEVRAPWAPTGPSDGYNVTLVTAANLVSIDFGSHRSDEFPIANPDTFEISGDQASLLAVYDNDGDPDHNSLNTGSIVIVRPPSHGQVFPQLLGGVIYQPNDGFTGADSFDYTIRNNDGLTSNIATVSIDVASATYQWHNEDQPLDVNVDGFITARDALFIVNLINEVGVGRLPEPSSDVAPPPYYDVSRDNMLTAIDALQIINWINEELAAAAEAEQIARESHQRLALKSEFASAVDAYYAEEEAKQRQALRAELASLK